MQRFLLRSTPLIHHPQGPPAAWSVCRFATASHHPNPGNFANRSKEQLAEAGRRGGKKGGKAHGAGGFHNMDPEKQHSIASRGGHAANKAAAQEEAVGRNIPTPGGPGEPSTAPPGYAPSTPA